MNKIQDWTTEQVAKWFSSIGCEQYTRLVMKEDLDGALLVKLKDQEWLDFGIKNSFHRKKVISKVEKLLNSSDDLSVQVEDDSSAIKRIKASNNSDNKRHNSSDNMLPDGTVVHNQTLSSGTMEHKPTNLNKGNRHRTWNDWDLQQSTHIAWSNSKSLQPRLEENRHFLGSKSDKVKSDSLLMSFSKSYEKTAESDLEKLTYQSMHPTKYPFLLKRGTSRTILVCNLNKKLLESELIYFFSKQNNFLIRDFKSYLPKCPMIVVTYFDIAHAKEMQERVHGRSFVRQSNANGMSTIKCSGLGWKDGAGARCVAYVGQMFAFSCIPTHAVYKEWNDGAICVKLTTTDRSFNDVEQIIHRAFSIYGPMICLPKELPRHINKKAIKSSLNPEPNFIDTKQYVVQFTDTIAADRALKFIPFLIGNMTVVSRNFLRPTTASLKIMFLFAHLLEEISLKCNSDDFLLQWCKKVTQEIHAGKHRNNVSKPENEVFLTKSKDLSTQLSQTMKNDDAQRIVSLDRNPPNVHYNLQVSPSKEDNGTGDKKSKDKKCNNSNNSNGKAVKLGLNVVEDENGQIQAYTNTPNKNSVEADVVYNHVHSLSPAASPQNQGSHNNYSEDSMFDSPNNDTRSLPSYKYGNNINYFGQKYPHYNAPFTSVNHHAFDMSSTTPASGHMIKNGMDMQMTIYNDSMPVACFNPAPLNNISTSKTQTKYNAKANKFDQRDIQHHQQQNQRYHYHQDRIHHQHMYPSSYNYNNQSEKTKNDCHYNNSNKKYNPTNSKPRHHGRHNFHINKGSQDSKAKLDERKQGKHNNNKLILNNIYNHVDTRCTLCMKNIPNRLTKKQMLEFLNIHYEKKYDYFYLPVDFKTDYNVGYCFINFISVDTVSSFYNMYHGKPWSSLIQQSRSVKVVDVCYANQQGKRNMIKRQFNSKIRTMDDKYQPSLFYSSGPSLGEEQDFQSAKVMYRIQ
jgi:hypothetical protein